MCLYTKSVFPRWATKNIPVYKELLISQDGSLVTPWMFTKVPLDGILRAKNTHPYFLPTEIKGGYIHVYSENSAVVKRRYNIESTLGPRKHGMIIVKGYIPKGTRYYIGESNELCAKKVVLEIPEYYKQYCKQLLDYELEKL